MVNDLSIAVTLLCIIVFTGTLLPFIYVMGNQPGSEYDAEAQIPDNFIEEISISNLGFGVLVSIASMFFWTFGALPIWLEMVFIVIRVVFILFVVRFARGIG